VSPGAARPSFSNSSPLTETPSDSRLHSRPSWKWRSGAPTEPPAYLEASILRSAALYERHGFTRIATIDFAPGVALYPMLWTPV
jgi:hypothetical protein